MTKLKYTLDRRTLDHLDMATGEDGYAAIRDGLSWWTHFFGFELSEEPGGVHIVADNLPFGYGGTYKKGLATIAYSPSTAGNIRKWNQGAVALIIAHEVGHHLGYPHIGDSCRDRMSCNTMFTFGGFWGSDANGRNGSIGPIDVAYGREVLKFGPSKNPRHPFVAIFERDIRPVIVRAQATAKRINELRRALQNKNTPSRDLIKKQLDESRIALAELRKIIDPAQKRLEEIVKPYGKYHETIYPFQFTEVVPQAPRRKDVEDEYRCSCKS